MSLQIQSCVAQTLSWDASRASMTHFRIWQQERTSQPLSDPLAVSGMRSWQPCTRTVSSPFPRHMIGRKARPRPAFLAVLGLLCFSGKGALGLATHDVVAPRHALRAAALCGAAQHAEIGIEAALTQLDRLPASELQRGAVLRYVAEASLEALEAEWRRTAAWIDDAREQLALASARAADLTSEHAAGVTGAFCWTLLYYCCLVKVRV